MKTDENGFWAVQVRIMNQYRKTWSNWTTLVSTTNGDTQERAQWIADAYYTGKDVVGDTRQARTVWIERK